MLNVIHKNFEEKLSNYLHQIGSSVSGRLSMLLWFLNQKQLFWSISCTHLIISTFYIVAELDNHMDFSFSS